MSFDRLATVYRMMESILAGNKLQRCRVAHLAQARQVRKALLLGEGHGRFIVPLLKMNPGVQVTSVDMSAGMLEETKLAMVLAGLDPTQVRFIQADALTWQSDNSGFDLISTHFFLDCFTAGQLDSLLPKLSALAAPEAIWIVSDFCSPDKGVARLRARMILWLMYRFFRVVTRLPATHLAEYTERLHQQGFRLEKREHFEWGLLRADLWRRDQPDFIR